MNIFIAGGGRVGFHLARLLSGERQDVTVIETDHDRLEEIDYSLDVSTVQGDGSSVMLQQSLNVGSAELFVASMGNDETNLIAATTAKGLGAKQVVARVDNPMYIESNILYETILSVDYILSPDALAALEIANFIENPGIVASEDFGRGLVQMRQIRVSRTPTTGKKTLKDVMPPRMGVLLAVVSRGIESFIPHGDTVIENGDYVTLVGHREKMPSVQRMFQGKETRPEKVAIMGGGRLGVHLSNALEERVKTVKLFERRLDRGTALAAQLHDTKIVCRDAASRGALEQEHVDTYDVFVATTGDDERNIMACVLAREVGVKQVVAIVHQPDFAPLVSRLGIDLAITPRTSIANRVLKLVHQKEITSLAVLGEGQVEVIELAVGSHSPMLNKPLKEIGGKLPRGALLATILRDNEVIVPSGDDALQEGDNVIAVAKAASIDAVRKLLQR